MPPLYFLHNALMCLQGRGEDTRTLPLSAKLSLPVAHSQSTQFAQFMLQVHGRNSALALCIVCRTLTCWALVSQPMYGKQGVQALVAPQSRILSVFAEQQHKVD